MNIEGIVEAVIIACVCLVLGSMADYSFLVFSGQDLPFIIDLIVGVFGSIFTVIVWLVALFW